ncbi:MAG: hypothetical protein M0026_16675 [Nocardiopsaceae bacterium]|nr:hypothetical protein [Nocardiopsaceae bacterium]
MGRNKGARRQATRRRLAAGGATLGITAALGVPLGVLWWFIAPRPEVTVIGDGATAPYPVSEATFAVDGYFALIMGVAGIVTGYGAYLAQYGAALRGRTDLRLACLLGTAFGALVGSVVAWRLGVLMDAGDFRRALDAARPGDVITSGLRLQALNALIVWPFIAVLQYGLFDGVSMWRRDLPHQRSAADAEQEEAAAPNAPEDEAPR